MRLRWTAAGVGNGGGPQEDTANPAKGRGGDDDKRVEGGVMAAWI